MLDASRAAGCTVLGFCALGSAGHRCSVEAIRLVTPSEPCWFRVILSCKDTAGAALLQDALIPQPGASLSGPAMVGQRGAECWEPPCPRFVLIPAGAASTREQTVPPTSTAGTATAFKMFPGRRDGRKGGEQQGMLLGAAGGAVGRWDELQEEGEVIGGVRLLPKAPGLPHTSSSFPTQT